MQFTIGPILPDSVRLVMDDGTNGMAARSIFRVEDTIADDAWLSYRPPIVPRQSAPGPGTYGAPREERRQFLPMQLDDGRQMVVPVDQVEFTPAALPVILYQ